MKTFKKIDFDKIKIIKESNSIKEFVNSDGSPIEGNHTVTNNSEIETGPVDKPFNDDSDYEKGISTTTDRASRYKQPRNWLTYFGYGGTPYSNGSRDGSLAENEDSSKSNIKQMLEDLVNKQKNDTEVGRKYSVGDINRNDIPDLDELNNPAIINKAKELLDVIYNNNLNSEQIAIILNYVISNINIKDISNDYKKILFKNING